MFGVSVPEILLVCVIALVVLGPERLPAAARNIGNLLAFIRKQADGVRREIYNSVYTPDSDIKNDFQSVAEDLRTVKSSIEETLLNTPEWNLNCEEKAQLEELKKKRELKKENEAKEIDEAVTGENEERE